MLRQLRSCQTLLIDYLVSLSLDLIVKSIVMA